MSRESNGRRTNRRGMRTRGWHEALGELSWGHETRRPPECAWGRTLRGKAGFLFMWVAPMSVELRVASAAFDGGRVFGAAGAYEELRGVARFAFDASAPENAAIVDLRLVGA